MLDIQCNITFEELVEAYFDCRANKRNSIGALEFEIQLEENLLSLFNDLVTGNYQISPSICFVVKQPKPREVWAANFRDRIVHHLLYNRYGHRFNRTFINDTFACIPNRGTLYGIHRLEKHIRSFTYNWTKEKYYLKCDLANFFTSIDKNILWKIQEEKLIQWKQEEWVITLAHFVLFNDCTINARFNSTNSEMRLVPKRKSLLFTEKDIGLPIGNLTSQLDANILMNEIDQYAKHSLKIKHYVRYVDDIVILGDSPKQCYKWFDLLKSKSSELKLKFGEKKTYCHLVSRGITFLGQTIYPYRTVPYRKTVERILTNVSNGSIMNNYLHYFKQARNHYNILQKVTSL